MSEAELNDILKKIEGELNGDPEHDADVLDTWGEKYREVPGAEPIMNVISRKLFDLMIAEDPEMPQMIYEDMVESADEEYRKACSLIAQNQYEEAEVKLSLLTKLIETYPLPEDAVWTDFTSFLEGMIYQDYFSEEIGDREIRRHPMHPGQILFTYGNLLIEMNEPGEALKPLEMLTALDPVCPKYLFELGEAYKRTGQFEEAFNNALWCLSCAVNNEELARCYRDMAYCLSEAENYKDAVMLYMLSLHFQPSRLAEAEIVRIQKKFGVRSADFTEEVIVNRCAEVGIPIGISDTVVQNMEMLEQMNLSAANEDEDKDANEDEYDDDNQL